MSHILMNFTPHESKYESFSEKEKSKTLPEPAWVLDTSILCFQLYTETVWSSSREATAKSNVLLEKQRAVTEPF